MDPKMIAAAGVVGMLALGGALSAQSEDMASLDAPGVSIRVMVEAPGFNDAMFFSAEEFAKLPAKEMEQRKQARVEAHAAFVAEQSAKETPPPTKEELEAAKASLERQAAEVEARLAVTAEAEKADMLLEEKAVPVK